MIDSEGMFEVVHRLARLWNAAGRQGLLSRFQQRAEGGSHPDMLIVAMAKLEEDPANAGRLLVRVAREGGGEVRQRAAFELVMLQRGVGKTPDLDDLSLEYEIRRLVEAWRLEEHGAAKEALKAASEAAELVLDMDGDPLVGRGILTEAMGILERKGDAERAAELSALRASLRKPQFSRLPRFP